MKLKKSIIIIMLLMTLITIPIGFASDLEANSIDSSHFDNDLLIGDNLEGDMVSDHINKESLESVDNANIIQESESENDNLSQFKVSDSLNSQSSSNLASTSQEYLANFDTSFSQVEINISDETTIFVNASYEGENETGTQLNPFKALESAYDFYMGQDEKTNIYLASGIYNLSSLLSLYKSINIIGENTVDVIIDGLNNSALFDISNSNTLVNIINLTLTNGLNLEGGAILLTYSSLNIINTKFYDNHAYDAGKGGVIYNNAGFLKIYNSTFLENSIHGKHSNYGAVIYNYLGELSIFNSSFINNSIQGNWSSGGAIYNFNGFLTLVNSSIINTTANSTYNSLGGAICNWNGRNAYIINSTITGTNISGNYVFGSAIANKGVLLEIINSTITDNYANGISYENTTVFNLNGRYNFENLTFENNSIKTINSTLLLCLEDQLIISNITDIDSLGDLPSRYDLRELGLVTSVKNQGADGDCWIFAIYGTLESYLLKFENITYDFSENNMKKEMNGGTNGYDWTDGGNHILAFAYLLRGSGPINESQDPRDSSLIINPEDLGVLKYVTGFEYLPLRLNYLDNDQIKFAILKYGALYTSIYSRIFSGYNGYSNTSNINNHAVAIVGWDDNYSRSNFEYAPPGDGAWIIKNSWGNSSGQNGYYYVSYYDATFPGVTDQFSAIAITDVENISEYSKIYQYDMLGNTYESLGYNCDTAWFANQFTADSNSPLKAFGIYTFGTSSYLVNVTVNGISKLVQEGNLSGAGYHTIKFDNLIKLAKGDIFKIAVKLTTPDSLFPIAIESQRSKLSSKAHAELNQSFISQDGINWYDIAKDTSVAKFYEDLNKITLRQTNVCLKVYTEYMDDLELIIKANSSYFVKESSIELNLTLFNKGDLSKEINVTSVLDDSISIISYNASNGVFDVTTKVWNIDQLANNASETLKLVLRFNEIKDVINISFFANSSSLSYNTTNATYKVSLGKYATQVIANNLNTTAIIVAVDGKIGKYLKMTLKDKDGKVLANKKVSFICNGKSYSRTTDSKGVASYQINFATAATYTFKISFAGDDMYGPSSKTVQVYVKKRALSLKVPNRAYKLNNKNKYLTAVLVNGQAKAIANKRIIFIVNGKQYKAITNAKGLAKVKVTLPKKKTYKFTVKFAGDKSYKAVTKIAKVVIK